MSQDSQQNLNFKLWQNKEIPYFFGVEMNLTIAHLNVLVLQKM